MSKDLMMSKYKSMNKSNRLIVKFRINYFNSVQDANRCHMIRAIKNALYAIIVTEFKIVKALIIIVKREFMKEDLCNVIIVEERHIILMVRDVFTLSALLIQICKI